MPPTQQKGEKRREKEMKIITYGAMTLWIVISLFLSKDSAISSLICLIAVFFFETGDDLKRWFSKPKGE